MYDFPPNLDYILDQKFLENIEIFDQENPFNCEINSSQFLQQSSEIYQKNPYFTLKNKNQTEKIIQLKTHAFLLSPKPFVLFSQNGYYTFLNNQFAVIKNSRFQQLLQKSFPKQIYEDLLIQIEKITTYVLLSQYQLFQQDAKYINNFELTFQFKISENQEKLEPVLTSFTTINIFQENLQLYYNRCDIIFTHNGMVEGIGQRHLNYNKQLWNHSPDSYNMHDKGKFYHILQKFDKKQKFTIDSTKFFPKSFVLSIDQVKYTEEEYRFLNYTEPENEKTKWIYKPTRMSRGRGITIIENLEEAKKIFKEDKEKAKNDIIKKLNKDGEYDEFQNTQPFIIQKYISDTQLLEGRKFDIRCYLFVAWFEPGYQLAFFHPGYIRRTMTNYQDGEQANYYDLKQHLTNLMISVDNYDPDKDVYKNQTIASFDQFKNHIIDKHGLTEEKVDQIEFKMKQVLAYSAEAYFDRYKTKAGAFQYFGMDIMFDKNWDPFLVEANRNPQMYVEKLEFYKIIGGFIESVINIETLFSEKRKDIHNIIRQKKYPLGNLQLLINRAAHINILEKKKKNENLETLQDGELNENLSYEYYLKNQYQQQSCENKNLIENNIQESKDKFNDLGIITVDI
ncbi:hypothetical protein PPERSA_03712 [Pseudocohnilembus persalinus]|uniref:Tubulin--tyrosine ligase-like protein 9 n=1 Tax=Pseudocohnilembus persalinus TaxID=266149 RepID=A0A0V0QHI4_PSEPJ|nr:hypothetical protein PPERSA_03712 [Pseudocohnilembus persalinus]|eukprot:KRX01628.1 hypothetical protein PPERSA_03712 [Pseudocohnilembus persalinus]